METLKEFEKQELQSLCDQAKCEINQLELEYKKKLEAQR